MITKNWAKKLGFNSIYSMILLFVKIGNKYLEEKD